MKKEIIEKLAQLITAAFGLVAALAWNDAIKAVFKEIFGKQSTLVAMIFYAVIITIVAVLVTIWIGNLSEKTMSKLNIKKKKLRNKKKVKKSNK